MSRVPFLPRLECDCVRAYDLRVGITGHRELARQADVADAIGRVLQWVVGTLGRHAALPLRLTAVSALAKGADQIFAEKVLALNGRLDVVTPFPIPEYTLDFDIAQDRDAFERLLASARAVEQLGGSRVSSEAAYRHAGETVVERCEVLVAVWNGLPSRGGGTADVVSYAVGRARRVIWIDAEAPEGAPRTISAVAYDGLGRLLEACSAELPASAAELSSGYCRASAGLA